MNVGVSAGFILIGILLLGIVLYGKASRVTTAFAYIFSSGAPAAKAAAVPGGGTSGAVVVPPTGTTEANGQSYVGNGNAAAFGAMFG